jgi:hypothetical protein
MVSLGHNESVGISLSSLMKSTRDDAYFTWTTMIALNHEINTTEQFGAGGNTHGASDMQFLRLLDIVIKIWHDESSQSEEGSFAIWLSWGSHETSAKETMDGGGWRCWLEGCAERVRVVHGRALVENGQCG